MTESAPVPEYICSVDIEKTRTEMGVGTNAVGISFAKADGTVLEERCYSKAVNIDSDDFDESKRKFWKQFPDVLERLNKNAETQPLEWSSIVAFLNYLEENYGPFGRSVQNKAKFHWICDNPAYDIGEINLMIHKMNPNARPLAEMFTDYVPTSDPTEQYEGLTKDEQAFVDSQLITPHSHHPTEDARRDNEMYVAIRKVLAMRDDVVRVQKKARSEERSESPTGEIYEATGP